LHQKCPMEFQRNPLVKYNSIDHQHMTLSYMIPPQ
jgi:hypothetical protein